MRSSVNITQYYYTELNGLFPISVHQHEFTSFEAHRHDFCEFEFVTEGKAQTEINGVVFPLEKGDTVFVTPSDIHGCTTLPGGKMKTVTVHFSPDAFPFFASLPSGVIHCSDALRNAFLLLLEESLKDDVLARYAVKNMLERVLILAKRESSGSTVESYTTGIAGAIGYINKHYKETITIADVCKACRYSAPWLCRHFKEQTGMTVMSYINRQRLDCAQRMLLMLDCAVGEIGLECGFVSVRQFNRAFRNAFGCSPSEYRRKHR